MYTFFCFVDIQNVDVDEKKNSIQNVDKKKNSIQNVDKILFRMLTWMLRILPKQIDSSFFLLEKSIFVRDNF